MNTGRPDETAYLGCMSGVGSSNSAKSMVGWREVDCVCVTNMQELKGSIC